MAFGRSRESAPPPLTYIETASGFIGALALLWVSPLAHWRSIEPSSLVIAYLSAKLACYAVLATVPGVAHDRPLEITRGCSIIPLLFLEIHGKGSILLPAYQSEPPEATTSFLGRVLFTWINPILFSGYTKILQVDDLPLLDRDLDSKNIRQTILREWDQRGPCLSHLVFQVFRMSLTGLAAKPEGGTTLPRVLLGCILRPFLMAIVPRVAVVIFRFAQALLISRAIRFVTQVSAASDQSGAYWLVVEATVVYVGMAVSAPRSLCVPGVS